MTHHAGADRAAPSRTTLALAGLCVVVLLAATLEVVLDAAVGHSPLTPGSPGIAGWLQWGSASAWASACS